MQRPWLLVREQLRCVVEREDRRFGHAVVQRRRDRIAAARRVSAAGARNAIGDAALDALDRIETADVRDVGRLARPGRDRAGTRDDDDRAFAALALSAAALARRAGRRSAARRGRAARRRRSRALRLHEVDEARGERFDCGHAQP